MTAHSEFGILGCVEVVGPRGQAEPLGGRHRALVAALALQPGVVVPCWQLVEALWGEQPPRTAVRSLHSHVARLRLVLDKCGLGGVLQTREPGYVLSVEAEAVDASRFELQMRSIRGDLAAGSIDGAATSLKAALSLWRGSALADAEPTGWTAAEAARLENLRSAALADHCEVMLCLGRYGEALGEAERLLNAEPMRERLVGLSMIALWGCGRPAEALDTYQRLRAGLADELGVDPSRDLTELHTTMLRGATATDLRAPGSVIGASPVSVAAAPRPAQLPAPVGYFTGRANELRALDDLTTRQVHGAPTVAVICGHGGIGKTSLAVQWAHRVADRFPDGQVFVDARGSDPTTALSPAEVAAVLLRCLGVPDDRVPNETGERVGMYRSLLSGKRMLIVLDNVGTTEQVASFVPGSAACLLLVTSRNNLAALVTHVEVSPIVLDMLSQNESADLLAKVLGAGRVNREPEAVARLAVLCCRMPLALRIAAAKLVTHPTRSISALADELSGDDRLAHLRVEGGTRTVEAVFASAYLALSPPAQRLFGRLGLHPGPHFGAPLAAAMCVVPLAELEPVLAELVAAHLISEPEPGRYRFHDLVRLFARRCAESDETAVVRAEVIERLLDWYLVTAQTAGRVLDSSLNRLTASLRHPAPEIPFPATREPALAFLEAERENLLAIVRYAGKDHPSAVCELTYLLAGFFAARGYLSERVQMCRHAVRAANRLGEPGVEAEMHRALGVAYFATHQLSQAVDSHLRALPLMKAHGDERGLAHLYNNIGSAYAEMRRFEESIEAYQIALRLHTNTGNQFGAVVVQRNLGYVHLQLDQIEVALPHLDRALTMSRAIGYQRLEASTLDCLGDAHLRQERHELALRFFREALAVSRKIGDLRYEMYALLNIGLTHMACGKASDAIEFFGQALAVSRQVTNRHAEARILNRLGEVHLLLRDHEAAQRFLTASAKLREGVPNAYEEARLHRNLGDLAQHTGNTSTAVTHWELAVGLFRNANAPAEADCLANRMPPRQGKGILIRTSPLVTVPTDGSKMVT